MCAFKTEPKGTLLDDSIRNLSLLKARKDDAVKHNAELPDDHQPMILVAPKQLYVKTIENYPADRAFILHGLNAEQIATVESMGL
jgi:hypothetical protein